MVRKLMEKDTGTHQYAQSHALKVQQIAPQRLFFGIKDFERSICFWKINSVSKPNDVSF